MFNHQEQAGRARSTFASPSVAQIKEYVFEDPDFEGLFKGWAQDNAHHFDLTTPVEEHTLQHTALHQQVSVPWRGGAKRQRHAHLCTSQFTELFNKKLGEQVEDAGVSVEDVFTHLAKEMEANPLSEVSLACLWPCLHSTAHATAHTPSTPRPRTPSL